MINTETISLGIQYSTTPADKEDVFGNRIITGHIVIN